MPKPLSREKRIARREKIAAQVRNLLSRNPPVSVEKALAAASAKFGVSLTLVRSACQQHGVELPRKESARFEPPRLKTLRIVAELMAEPATFGGRSEAEIARQFKLSRERVRQIKVAAIEAGVLRK